MNKKLCLYFIILFMLIGTGVSLAADDSATLHTYYEQNGDCYILIGEGSKRAVWALNNLVTGKQPQILYDPYDAYGITAAQKWNASSAKTEKDLFTFASNETGSTSLAGQKVPRRIVMTTSTTVHGFTTVPAHTVHRFHSEPNAGRTGKGNHPDGTINSLFGGIDYPCNTIPAAVATMPGYYWYPVGKGYYHAYDVPVWSNWTYARHNKRAANNPPAASERYDPRNGLPPHKRPMDGLL